MGGNKQAPRVKFLTFNTWGLKFVSKFRKQRLQAIADALLRDQEDYDVVALQEIWTKEDWDYIDETLKEAFPYRRIFYSGIIAGPGLATLSKIPIESTFLYRFPINGRPSAFWRGDWYVGKSAAVTLLKPIGEDLYPLAILNSHMHAPYSLEGDAAYFCHRSCQAWDFAKLSNLLSHAGYAVVIVGDLNSRPGSLPHKFLTLETSLVDSWEQLHGQQNLELIKTLSPQEQIDVGGTTCDSILNTWRADRHPEEACRLDYALVDGSKLRAVDAKVRFTEHIPDIGSFSDHFAYYCELELIPKKVLGEVSKPNTGNGTVKLDYHDEMLDLLEEYKKTAEWQSTWRLAHFFISVLLVVVIHIVVTFTAIVAPWASVLWVLGSTAIGVTGTVNGLIGFLFGRSELRALEEVKQEVLDSRRSIGKGV